MNFARSIAPFHWRMNETEFRSDRSGVWPIFGMVEDQLDKFQWEPLDQEEFDPNDGTHAWKLTYIEFDKSLIQRVLALNYLRHLREAVRVTVLAPVLASARTMA